MRRSRVASALLGLVLFTLSVSPLSGAPVALARGGAPAAPQPLVELQRIEFETAYAGRIVSDSLAFSSDGRIVYATSHGDLFVVSAADGSVLDTLTLLEPGGQDPWGFRVAMGGTQADPLLVAWNDSPAALLAFSLADPAHPTLVSELSPGSDLSRVVPIPGTTTAVVLGKNARVVDLLGGAVLHVFAARTSSTIWGRAIVGGAAGRPVLALPERGYSSGSYYSFVDVYDVSDPAQPAIITGWEGSPSRLAFDGRGEIVVSCGYPCEVRSALDGSVLSSFPSPAGLGDLVLAEGGGARAVVMADHAAVQIVDLADPAAPGEARTVEAGLHPQYWNGWHGLLSASGTAPLVAVSLYSEGAVLVLDVRTGDVVSRWDAGGPRPAMVLIGDGPAGARTAAVVSMRISGEEVFARGGVSELDLLDLGSPATPALAGRVLRPTPRDIHAFGVLDRGLAVAADPNTNSLALFALEDGRVLDVTGFFEPFQESADGALLFSRGRTVLAVEGWSWEVFDVRRGRLVSRARGSLAYTSELAHHGGVLPDGTAVVLTTKRLLTILPDGRRGELPLEAPGPTTETYWLELEVSPSGDSVLISPGVLVSLADPAHPVIAWRASRWMMNAAFVDGGRSILATFDSTGGSFRTGLFDARTGQPRGPSSDPIEMVFYHGMGTAFGEGPQSRVVLWRWTWSGWKTVLLDVSGSTPVVAAVLPEFFCFPDYLPRAGGGWYEFRGGRSSEILVSLGDEAQTSVWQLAGRWWHSPRTVRPGVIAAVEERQRGLAISVWGDPSTVRPVATVRGVRR